MTFTTLISTEQLAPHLADPAWAVVDCRFSLQDTGLGQRNYRQAHIPGAVYAHLDEDLSGPIIPGRTSRHPLPDVDAFARTLSNWGISAGVQVVAYDDMGGAIAARLWWMLRWLGHEAVAVLDGGWSAWQRQDRPTRSDQETRTPRTFVPRPRPELLVDVADVAARLGDPSVRLVDSRAADRYRGENETLDPVAGHIPGAINAFYGDNLGEDGRFLSPAVLRGRFQAILGDVPPARTVFCCGSGVTAAHNVLACLHAGMGETRLYAGSWSEWITDPERPIYTL